jgi:hypothetical protein
MNINVSLFYLLFLITFTSTFTFIKSLEIDTKYNDESMNIYTKTYPLKSYLKYDNTNYTETIYMELSFNIYGNLTLSKSNYKINLYWFTNETFENYSSNYFYGIANTNFDGDNPQSDVIICKTFYEQQRCDDYYIDHRNLNYTNDFYDTNKFYLDYRIGGEDNILNYFQVDTIYSAEQVVKPFKSLFQFTIFKPVYALEKYDQDFNFNNTFSIFYGSIDNSIDYNAYLFPRFQTKRLLTYNFTDLLSSSSFLKINIFIYLIFIF